MKRYISLACIVLVIVTCIVSPVSAADNHFIDVLSLTSPGGSGSYISYGNDGFISSSFTLPFNINKNYISMLIYTDLSNFSCSYIDGGFSRSLTVIPVAGYYYRIFGDISGVSGTSFNINFNGDSGSFVGYKSFNISVVPFDIFDEDCYCNIGALDYDKSIHFVSSDEINYRSFVGTSDYHLAGYTLYIYKPDWQAYDYIDFVMYCTVDSITSISCEMGGTKVPFDCSFIENDSMTSNDFFYSIRVDLTGLDRTSSDYPMITVMGNVITDSANLISVVSCNAFNESSDFDSSNVLLSLLLNKVNSLISSLAVHFNNLSSWINNQNSLLQSQFSQLNTSIGIHFDNLSSWINDQNSLLASQFSQLNTSIAIHFNNLDSWLSNQTSILEAAIRGDTSPGDSFQQQVNQKDQQLNDMAAVMDSVNQPDLNTVNVSANTYVDSTVLAASMSGITSVFSQGLYFDIIVMSIMLATAGYVLFGKR